MLNSNHNLDKKLLASLSRKRLPNFKQLKYLNKFLDKRDSWLLSLGSLLLLSGLVLAGTSFYQNNLATVPVGGGKYTEGAVGKPQFINPLYASLSGVDADLSRLIFSSLFDRDNNGYLNKDLVESYQLSPDQKTYTFKLLQGVKWHTGGELTAADVVFTFNKIQDPDYKSPLRSSFIGVVAKQLDDYSFSLTLPEAYAPFPELLTFGILPKGLWEEVGPNNAWLNELNIKPVGSGPYEFSSLVKDRNGSIRYYNLSANKEYYRQKPYLDKISFKFFVSEEELVSAINGGSIDGASYLSGESLQAVTTENSYNFYRLKIPENTALIFNLRDKNSSLVSQKIRQALALAIDKNKLVKEVLADSASVSNSPIPASSFGFSTETSNYNYDLEAAKKILSDEGWQLADGDDGQKILTKKGQNLSLKLSLIDSLENIAVAEAISAAWQELGIKTELDIVSRNEFQNAIIRPKNFQILLYSWLVGIDPDPYQRWHSSQTGEKGLNVSGYANAKIDKLLEQARLSNDTNQRLDSYKQFQKELTADLPAIFLYTPNYTYLQNKRIKGFSTQVIINPEDRFNQSPSWYNKETKTLNLK